MTTARLKTPPSPQPQPPQPQAQPQPPQPLLRLVLAAPVGVPRRIDGAWWPRSYDCTTELPPLLAGLPAAWGRVSSVTVSGPAWGRPPRQLSVAGRTVRLHHSATVREPDTVCLVAPGQGRWDLVVVPPRTPEADAAALMRAAVAP